ncbi:MAG: aminotransferase class I/II-fold pyridoxal phosphate-dependent enzyme, partial [Candidatus Competibacterales bacterium]|nr:aminotransferase class I/II-fold pyridoxal phosphate-dependent enzyme [Candidatus Competibacterales bacterium]
PGDLTEAWLDQLRGATLNRYPDPAAQPLKQRLRATFDLPEGADLVLGNGSDELIQLLALLLLDPDGERRTVLTPEPGFVMYRMIATFAGLDYVGVPLRADDFALDEAAMLAAIERHRPVLVFLAYPNNPTGNLFDPAVMTRIIEATPGLVVVDEAYSAFAGTSFLPRLAAHGNLLVMRTVSKLGLAGLRLGYLVGAPCWLEQIEKLRLPYNINTLTQLSAEFALRYGDRFDAQAAALRAAREELAATLARQTGVTVYPSAANFLLFRVPAGQAAVVFEGLRARGVLIKNLDRPATPLADCLRVTVGMPEQNAAFVAALAAALADAGA